MCARPPRRSALTLQLLLSHNAKHKRLWFPHFRSPRLLSLWSPLPLRRHVLLPRLLRCLPHARNRKGRLSLPGLRSDLKTHIFLAREMTPPQSPLLTPPSLGAILAAKASRRDQLALARSESVLSRTLKLLGTLLARTVSTAAIAPNAEGLAAAPRAAPLVSSVGTAIHLTQQGAPHGRLGPAALLLPSAVPRNYSPTRTHTLKFVLPGRSAWHPHSPVRKTAPNARGPSAADVPHMILKSPQFSGHNL